MPPEGPLRFYSLLFDFRFVSAAEGARTPNLWFRRPTLYPVELQPLLLKTNIVYNTGFNGIIIRILPCFASKLDGGNRLHRRITSIKMLVMV
jgi:hypothetical protein